MFLNKRYKIVKIVGKVHVIYMFKQLIFYIDLGYIKQ